MTVTVDIGQTNSVVLLAVLFINTGSVLNTDMGLIQPSREQVSMEWFDINVFNLFTLRHQTLFFILHGILRRI